MKLRGKWVTVNSITRFVRDPDPVKPRRKRKPRKQQPKVLRPHDYPPVRAKETKVRKTHTIAPPRSRRFRERTKAVEWDDAPTDLRLHHVRSHADLELRRARGIYDRPVPSPYALTLLANRETAGTVAVNPLPPGCRMKGFTVPLEDSSFVSFYLLGSATAAGNPRRPCDRAGIF